MQTEKDRKQIGTWLICCCVLVFLMVLIGGLTRLTESGLSMADWKPIKNIFPPHTEEKWEDYFTLYKETPEFKKKNFDLDLEGFKQIFWLEYIHRVVGRLSGVVFFLPLLWFAARRKLSGRAFLKFGGIFLLGGAQGLLGWYMVKSGLVDDPRVSPYRLTAHLLMAFTLFGLLFWQTCNYRLRIEEGEQKDAMLYPFASIIPSLIFFQVALGGLVAGNDAGLVYNSFPYMGEGIFPPELFNKTPWHINLFEDAVTVQFIHRWFAFIVAGATVLFWYLIKTNATIGSVLRAANWLLVGVLTQVGLGIYTLIYQVPVAAASLHQMVALLLFAVSLFIYWKLRAIFRAREQG
jgi:cytochrome c oxidase assembly protein subunit 15